MSAARGVQTALALVLCAAAPAVALAAEPLSGPVAGYIFDGASRGPGQTPRGIRPIYGIPGSAMLGAPVTLPFPVDFAVLSASGEFALARSASPDQPVWVIQGLAGAQPSLTPLPGALADARIVMNAQGSAAVLYSASKLQFVWGLPDQPTAGEAIALPDWHGRYSAIAVSGVSVSKDGSWALLAVTGEPEGGLYLVRNPRGTASEMSAGPRRTENEVRGARHRLTDETSGAARRVATLGSPSSVVLLHGDQDAIVADRTSDRVYQLRDIRGAAELTPLAGAHTPVAVQVVHGDEVLLVVNAGDSSVVAIDLAALNVIQTVPLAGSPTRATPLGGDVFLLNEPESAPLLLLDAAAPTYRSVFVPVPGGY